MRRVAVRGSSGSGKSTLAAALAERLHVPHVELDALFHLVDWQSATPEDFRAAVEQATAGDAWVADGNYAIAVDVVRPRVDTVVFLDLPKALVMRRLVRRTLGRGLLRRPLWNGNRESVWGLFRRDPDANVVWWTWQAFEGRHAEAVAAADDPDWAHAEVVRLTSPSQVAAWLAAVPDPAG